MIDMFGSAFGDMHMGLEVLELFLETFALHYTMGLISDWIDSYERNDLIGFLSVVTYSIGSVT